MMQTIAAVSLDALPPAPLAPLRTASAARAGGAANLDGAELRLAQLLCARVCHDLIGAAGAIETGVELLGEESADQADIFDLIGLSGRQLNRRLAFYRCAFGMSGRADGCRALVEVKRLAEGFLEAGRVALRWEIDEAEAGGCRLDGTDARLLLCAILVAHESLPRGGELIVRLRCDDGGTAMALEARGRNAAIQEDVAGALSGDADLDGVGVRTVAAYYLSLQSRITARDLAVRREEGGFSLAITAAAR